MEEIVDEIFKEIQEIYIKYDDSLEQLDNTSEDQIKEAIKKAINYTRCCESDSEQLIAFSDWIFEQPLHLGGNERKLVKQYLEGN